MKGLPWQVFEYLHLRLQGNKVQFLGKMLQNRDQRIREHGQVIRGKYLVYRMVWMSDECTGWSGILWRLIRSRSHVNLVNPSQASKWIRCTFSRNSKYPEVEGYFQVHTRSFESKVEGWIGVLYRNALGTRWSICRKQLSKWKLLLKCIQSWEFGVH